MDWYDGFVSANIRTCQKMYKNILSHIRKFFHRMIEYYQKIMNDMIRKYTEVYNVKVYNNWWFTLSDEMTIGAYVYLHLTVISMSIKQNLLSYTWQFRDAGWRIVKVRYVVHCKWEIGVQITVVVIVHAISTRVSLDICVHYLHHSMNWATE